MIVSIGNMRKAILISGLLIGMLILPLNISTTKAEDAAPQKIAQFIVVDGDGDGIELVPLSESNVYFDVDGDNLAERTGWVAPDDGILCIFLPELQKEHDMKVRYRAFATGGMQSLRKLNFDRDDIIQAEQFRNYRSFYYFVWFDRNQNGRIASNREEIDIGEEYIEELSLENSLQAPERHPEYKILHKGTAKWSEGRIVEYWIVEFKYEDTNTDWNIN